MNYLDIELHIFFREIGQLQYKNIVVNSFIRNFHNQLIERETVNRNLIGSIFCFRDISDLHSRHNLYETGYNYDLTVTDLNCEIEKLINWQNGLVFAQAYEIFESFLYNIYSNYFLNNRDRLTEFSSNNDIDWSNIRNELKKLCKRKKNKEFFVILRKLSKHYRTHEDKNIYNINIGLWFNLISEIRHNIIHNQQRISTSLRKLLQGKNNEVLFARYFSEKEINENQMIFISIEKFNENINLLNEFAYFIYKSLCIDNNLDFHWRKSF